MKYFLLFILGVFFGLNIYGQDTLPNFKAINLLNGRAILSWKSNYLSNVKQLSILRSTDSLRGFKTLASMPNPNVPINGFSDNKATPGIKYFYKFYIILEGNIFINTKSKAATVDTSWKNNKTNYFGNDITEVKKNGKKVVPVSKCVFNAKSGDIILKLNDASDKILYDIIFYNATEKIFELNNLNEKYYIVDKVNFVKKGCYNFEVFINKAKVEKFNICL